jgi:hypothetical protein
MHKLLRPGSNSEYAPPPPSAVQREAARRVAALADDLARRHGIDRRAFLRSSMGAAATLFTLAACSKEEGRATGGTSTTGTFAVPPESTTDPEAAGEVLAPLDGEVIVDVQTHFLDPDNGFGGGFPQAFCGEDQCFTIDQWADLVLGTSDTSLAVLSALPIVSDDHPMSIEKMEQARALVERLCGDGRVLLQGEAFPQVGVVGDTLDRMAVLATEHDLVAWKTYTHIAGGYSFLDDVGAAFLARVEELAAAEVGPAVVCVHKGFGADPADLGPAAAAHPDITFIAYHSGFEPQNAEAAFREGGGGVDRLVRSLRDAGIEPGGNAYAELGSTWFNVLRDPTQAAHTLGKLLLAVGPDNIIWGTDSIWYGSPQDQIDAFRTFEITTEAQDQFGYPALTPEIKRAILGGNAARVHGLDLDAVTAPCEFSAEEREAAREEAFGRLGGVGEDLLGPTTAVAAAATFRRDHPWFFDR